MAKRSRAERGVYVRCQDQGSCANRTCHAFCSGETLPLSHVLDLKEIGAPVGLRGVVKSITATPEIEAGPGRVVLTTVNQLNGFVFDMTLRNAAGVAETLGVTGWHKFYSEDRGGWISTSELHLGETLRGHEGPIVVTSLARDPGVHRVYNLTVGRRKRVRCAFIDRTRSRR